MQAALEEAKLLCGLDAEIQEAHAMLDKKNNMVKSLQSADTIIELEAEIKEARKFEGIEMAIEEAQTKLATKRANVESHAARLEGAQTITELGVVLVQARNGVNEVGIDAEKERAGQRLLEMVAVEKSLKSAQTVAELQAHLEKATLLGGLDEEIKSAVAKSLQLAETIPHLEQQICQANELGGLNQAVKQARGRLDGKKAMVTALHSTWAIAQLKEKLQKASAMGGLDDEMRPVAERLERNIAAASALSSANCIDELEAKLMEASTLRGLDEEIEEARGRLKEKESMVKALHHAETIIDIERHLKDASQLGGLEQEMRLAEDRLVAKKNVVELLHSAETDIELKNKIAEASEIKGIETELNEAHVRLKLITASRVQKGLKPTQLLTRCNEALDLALEVPAAEWLQPDIEMCKAFQTQLSNEKELREAARTNDISKLANLINKNVGANEVDDDGFPPIYDAAKKGSAQVVRELCRFPGLQTQVTDQKGWTPLHHAASEGHVGVIAVLLEIAKVPDDPKTNLGQTPLELAKLAAHKNEGSAGAVAALGKDNLNAYNNLDHDAKNLLLVAG